MTNMAKLAQYANPATRYTHTLSFVATEFGCSDIIGAIHDLGDLVKVVSVGGEDNIKWSDYGGHLLAEQVVQESGWDFHPVGQQVVSNLDDTSPFVTVRIYVEPQYAEAVQFKLKDTEIELDAVPAKSYEDVFREVKDRSYAEFKQLADRGLMNRQEEFICRVRIIRECGFLQEAWPNKRPTTEELTEKSEQAQCFLQTQLDGKSDELLDAVCQVVVDAFNKIKNILPP